MKIGQTVWLITEGLTAGNDKHRYIGLCLAYVVNADAETAALTINRYGAQVFFRPTSQVYGNEMVALGALEARAAELRRQGKHVTIETIKP